jgi:vacuolar protein sorting-associated protein VTA1|tara:strand:+ start:2938 stop:3699 length:762 start_codon:yes stop_codon:yes gene_type:complete
MRDGLTSTAARAQRTKRSTPLSGDVLVDYSTCRKFALEVYDRADRADRAGKRTKDTVEAFSAASTFLRALEHFEELPEERRVTRDEDCSRRREFAEWRSFDLMQAMQLGRKPTELKTLSDPAPPAVVSERNEPVVAPPPVRRSSSLAAAAAAPSSPLLSFAPPPPPPPPVEETRESPVDASTSSAGTDVEQSIVESESETKPPAPSAPPPPPPPADEVSEKMEALDVNKTSALDEDASEEARSNVEDETKEEE